MKKKAIKVYQKVLILFTVLQGLFLSMPVHALADTKLVTGSKNLISDATTILVGIEAAAVGALIVVNLYKYKFGEEEEKPKHKKNAKNILITGIIVITASGTIGVLFGYFV